MEVSGGVLAAVAAALGRDVELRGRTERGESGTTFLLDDDLVLKLVPDGAGVLADQERLVRLVGRLRQRGSPAPAYVTVGRAHGVVFTVQERLPGQGLDVSSIDTVLGEVLDAVELQADAGEPDGPRWPDWLLDTIERGGDGYCLHATMRRQPDTAALLDRLVAIASVNARGPVRSTDALHFDLAPPNILHADGRLTGIVDWSVPWGGDRGFDVATLLFYAYDQDVVRAHLEERAVALSGREWTTVYLCHLVLRQVEWSRRHRPGTAEDRYFIARATRVLDDCG